MSVSAHLSYRHTYDWLIVQPIAILLGILCAFVGVQTCEPLAQLVGQTRAQGPAAQALFSLPIRAAQYSLVHDSNTTSAALTGSLLSDSPSSYSRDVFGYQKTDEDGDGCSIREDILARDLTHVRFRSGSCIVLSGDLRDPYTGQLIHFTRGRTTSSLIQIDHVVALHDAWKSGAKNWDSARLMAFGNDPLNLLAVQGQANQDKSDASADQWLPENKSFQCEYAARQIAVKSKYRLSVTSSEKNALARVLHSCPGQPLPTVQSTRLPAIPLQRG